MVVVKQKQRQKDSSFIARAVIEGNEKFLIMAGLYKTHKNLVNERNNTMRKILKIYNLVFKNFSRKKILLGQIRGKPYYASTKGITIPAFMGDIDDFSRNYYYPYTNIYKEINEIGANRALLYPNLKPAKKKIFNDFFKYHKYVKEEPKAIIKTKAPIEIIEICAGFEKPFIYKKFNALSMIPDRDNEYDFNYSLNGQIILTIKFNRLFVNNAISEKAFIEQSFNLMQTLLKKEIKNRQKEIRRLNKMHDKLKVHCCIKGS